MSHDVVQAIRESAAGNWMMFVDGENFAIQVRHLAKAHSVEIVEGPRYIPDVFAWDPGSPGRNAIGNIRSAVGGGPARRAYYYTSCTGDDDQLAMVRQTIWEAGFAPQVFKKAKGGKSKGVDITLSTDLLTHSIDGHLDAAVLVAGDGDYTPLVEAVKKRGKRIVVAFFAELPALNPNLKLAADTFVDLGPYMVSSWKSWHQHQKQMKEQREQMEKAAKAAGTLK